MHTELFGDETRALPLPCWCELDVDHTHSQWVDAGGPPTNGRADDF